MLLVEKIVDRSIPPPVCRPVLLIVEGQRDIEFLARLSHRLAAELLHVPDLRELAAAGRVLFVPFGGGNPRAWADRLAPLGCHEFHLYDRELEPESTLRFCCRDRVNARPGCRAFVTSKRSLENYLHPQAILAAGGGEVSFGDEENVAALVAQSWYERKPQLSNWSELRPKTRVRWRECAKVWLNSVAVEHMTPAWLTERDPEGELLGWLSVISEMLDSATH
jgi:hypothetical protein